MVIKDSILQPYYEFIESEYKLYGNNHGYEMLDRSKDITKIISRIDIELDNFTYDKYMIIKNVCDCDFIEMSFYASDKEEYYNYKNKMKLKKRGENNEI